MSKKSFEDNPIIKAERRMFAANLMQDVSVPQKDLAGIPKPADRRAGWIAYQDRVVFVILDRRNNPRIRTGHITSTAGTSHINTDNVSNTVVWSDQVLNDLADNADDAHEKSFDPKDPRLLRLDEVEVLRDLHRSATWFEGIYPPEMACYISALFALSDFGRSAELEETAQLQKLAEEAAKRKLGYYDRDGKFNPPIKDNQVHASA